MILLFVRADPIGLELISNIVDSGRVTGRSTVWAKTNTGIQIQYSSQGLTLASESMFHFKSHAIIKAHLCL